VAQQILVAEDDELLRNLLAIVLGQEGFDVSACANGKIAMDRLDAAKKDGKLPVMVILDLTMPVVDGWKVAAWLDADPALKDIPVVVTSASEEHGETAKALHADAYLVKPYDTDEILGIVDLFLLAGRSRISSELPSESTTDSNSDNHH
jgi:CheY-like chemotaxis protein